MRVLCLRGHSGSGRVDLECLVDPTHGQWSPVISSVLRETGCPKCGRIRSEAFKKTKSDETKQRLQARIDRAHGAGKIAFSEESYVNSKLPVEVRCLVDSEHGAWPVVISVLIRGKGCPKCWEQAQAAKTARKGGGRRKPPARRASTPRIPGLGTLTATAPLPGYPPGFPYYSGKPTTLLGKSFPSIAQAAQHFGIKDDVLRKRRAAGWTDEQILGLAPPPGIRRRTGAVEIKGETFLSLLEAVQFYRASYEKVLLKLKHGLSIEEAVLQSQAEVELARKRAEAAELRRRFGASKSALVDYVRTDPKVYVIRNTVNSKEYVGVTDQTLATRFGSHKRDARTGKGPPDGLHCAMRELGIDKFSIELLERFPTYQDAAQAEVRLIAERGTRVPNGYNLREGGNFGQISGKVYEVDGVKYYGLRTLARSFGLPDCRVAYRLNVGWTLRQSLELEPPPVKETKIAAGTPQTPRSYVVTDLANRDYFVQDMPTFARDVGVSPRTNPIRNLASRGYTTRRAKGWKCRYATSEDEASLPRWVGMEQLVS
jgi:hypothetical protein